MPSPVLVLQGRNHPTELPGQRLQRCESRLPAALGNKTVQKTPENSILGPFVNVGIVAVEIAQAGLESIGALFAASSSLM